MSTFSSLSDRFNAAPPVVRAVVVVFAVAALTIAAYSNTFNASFHLDDTHQIVNNPFIRDISNLPRFFTEGGLNSSFSYTSFYRPVTTASFAISYAMGGYDVLWYHVLNVTLHIANALLVFLLTRTVLKLAGRADGYGVPLAVCLVFALHPIQTHAVSYISARAVLLASFFSLSSLYCFIRFRTAEGGRYAWGIAAPALFLLGMLSKEMAAGMLGIILLFDIILSPARRDRGASYWAYYSAFLASAAVVFVRMGKLDMPYTRLEYLMSQAKVVAMYIRLMVLPYGQNADYLMPITRSVDLGVAASALLITASVVLLWRIRKTMPAEAFFGLWFFIALMPESSIVPIFDIAVEYRVYLPSVGLFALAALLANRAALKPAVKTAAAAIVIIAFSVLTFSRNRVWATEYTYWSDVYSKSPHSFRAAVNVGNSLYRAGDLENAARYYEEARGLNTGREGHLVHTLYDKLGEIYFSKGMFAKAAEVFEKQTAIFRDDPVVEYNLSVALMLSGNNGEAEDHMKRVLELGMDNYDVRYNLALIYEQAGRRAEAVKQAEAARDVAGGYSQVSEAVELLDRLKYAGRPRRGPQGH